MVLKREEWTETMQRKLSSCLPCHLLLSSLYLKSIGSIHFGQDITKLARQIPRDSLRTIKQSFLMHLIRVV
ncbi:unnamed protein product [Lactuca virosa]|uniref:Uncharacterized protein n=1 Tax=Lactuca virosa TaxID=75947 RepID=A0AAU9NXI2_9ASTR|nr:unnamed protein product [Lactuca virosa]CAH1442519.1 unnamed protein product [Lactuca virosa]